MSKIEMRLDKLEKEIKEIRASLQEDDEIIYVPKEIGLTKSCNELRIGVGIVNTRDQELYFDFDENQFCVSKDFSNNTGKNFRLIKADKMQKGKVYLVGSIEEYDLKDIVNYELFDGKYRIFWNEEILKFDEYKCIGSLYEVVYCGD